MSRASTSPSLLFKGRTWLCSSAIPRPLLAHHPLTPFNPLPASTATMGLTEINTLEEFKAAISGDKPAVIDFWATWCGPCRFISPVFEKLSEQFPGVAFYKVDVDEAADISQEVGIRTLPTFMAFKDSAKIETITGTDLQALNKMIAQVAGAA